MVTCEEIRRKFSEYYDNCLNENDVKEVEKHIEKCSDCLKELEKFCKASKGVDDFIMVEPLVENIWEKIQKEINDKLYISKRILKYLSELKIIKIAKKYEQRYIQRHKQSKKESDAYEIKH